MIVLTSYLTTHLARATDNITNTITTTLATFKANETSKKPKEAVLPGSSPTKT